MKDFIRESRRVSTNQLVIVTVPFNGQYQLSYLLDFFPFVAQCPIAWQYFAASCYWKFPIKRSWSEARHECGRFRADLVVIDTDNEFDYIARNLTDLREDFYVGFHYFNGKG